VDKGYSSIHNQNFKERKGRDIFCLSKKYPYQFGNLTSVKSVEVQIWESKTLNFGT
jgi:hypothetical protein